MPTWTLTEIERAIRNSWSSETAFLDESSPIWRAENPSRGQCGTTALVVQDLLGGGRIIKENIRSGQPSGVHYWNRLGALEVDLTYEQFGQIHEIGAPRIVTRPAGGPLAGTRQYELLRRKVLTALGNPDR